MKKQNNLTTRKTDSIQENFKQQMEKDGNKNILKNIPLNKFRIGFFHAPVENSINPLYLASKIYLNSNSRNEVIDLLDQFRLQVTYESPNELLGLTKKIFTENKSLFDFVFPWDDRDAGSWENMVLENIRNENKLYGLDSYCHFGSKDCTYEKTVVEANRVIDLIDSISKHGFKPKPGDINAYLFVSDNDYSLMINGGNHRIAALAVMNYKSVECQIIKPIIREEARNWKHVKSGVYTEKQALNLFDSIIEGKLPKAFEKWSCYLKSTNYHRKKQ